MNYTIILPDEDRQAIAAALGKLVQALTNAAPVIDYTPVDLTKNIYGAGAQASTASTPSLPNSADPPRASQNPSPEARDRWAIDKAGNPWKVTSKGVRAIDVHMWSTEQTPTFLRVIWQNQGTGHSNANCFDSELWPWLIARSKETSRVTRLYVTTKGNYTNIVGVRA